MTSARGPEVDENRPPSTRPRLHAPGIVLFLSFVDVFALLPTVAPHVESLGAGPFALGVTVAAYSVANLPANIVGGILIDRFGRRRVLIIGLVLAAAAVAGYPLAGTVATLVIARLLHGVAGGILTPAVFAVAGDRVRRDAAGRAFGRLGALIGLAAVVAPAGAGIVRQISGTDAVFLGVAGVLLVGAVIAIGWIYDVQAPPRAGVGRLPLRPLLELPALRRGLIATVVLTMNVGVLAAFLPGAAEAVGASPSAVGGLFTTYALVAGAVMLSPLAGRIDRSAASRVAAAGLGLLVLSLAVLAVASSLPLLIVGSALFGGGYGLVFPAVAGATSANTDVRSRGRAFGLFNAAFSVGIAVGPPLVGSLVERIPTADPFVPTAIVTLVIALGLLRRPDATAEGPRSDGPSGLA